MNKNQIFGDDYKKELRKEKNDKNMALFNQAKKRFGAFKIPSLLKEEDKKHFQSIYKFDEGSLDLYKLPQERKTKFARMEMDEEGEGHVEGVKTVRDQKKASTIDMEIMEQLQGEEVAEDEVGY